MKWYCLPSVNSKDDEFLLEFFIPGTSEVMAILSLPVRLADPVIASRRIGPKFQSKEFRSYFLGLNWIEKFLEEVTENL